jgi:hypothetical protein
LATISGYKNSMKNQNQTPNKPALRLLADSLEDFAPGAEANAADEVATVLNPRAHFGSAA